MKILLILTASFDQGGTQNDMIQLARSMAPLGYSFHLAAPKGTLVPQLERSGVVFHAVPNPLSNPGGMIGYVLALAWIVIKNNFQILAPQSVRSSLAAGIIRKMRVTKAPVVASLHNLHNPASSKTAARILKRSCQMVTLENHYERRLVGLDKTNDGLSTSVVYSGVDLNIFNPKPGQRPVPDLPKPKGHLVGCIARLSEEKDHSTLLKAWRHHIITHPNDRLILVGDGPESGKLEREIALLGIGHNVRLLGERNDVESILPHLDLFILSSRRESYPRSAREALACGVPVILPAIGGCGEIVSSPDAGLLFQEGDWINLAKKMKQIFQDGKTKTERKNLARLHAEKNFPMEKWRKNMDHLYKQFASYSGKERLSA